MGWSSLAAMRRALLALALAAMATPAVAQQQVKIGIGFGIAFLPTYLCQELMLVEKEAKAAGLDVKTSYLRFSGSGPMQDAILSGAIDMGPYGVSALLIAWEKARNTPQQTFAISGVDHIAFGAGDQSGQYKVDQGSGAERPHFDALAGLAADVSSADGIGKGLRAWSIRQAPRPGGLAAASGIFSTRSCRVRPR